MAGNGLRSDKIQGAKLPCAYRIGDDDFFYQIAMFNIEPRMNGLHALWMEMEERDLGTQPLEAIMQRWGVTNHDLVEDSPEQLTHKQIQRAKAGRRLTLKMMMKVARSLNIAVWNRLSKENKETYVEYLHKDIFSYAKDYNPDKADPNEAMIQALTKI